MKRRLGGARPLPGDGPVQSLPALEAGHERLEPTRSDGAVGGGGRHLPAEGEPTVAPLGGGMQVAVPGHDGGAQCSHNWYVGTNPRQALAD